MEPTKRKGCQDQKKWSAIYNVGAEARKLSKHAATVGRDRQHCTMTGTIAAVKSSKI